MLDVQSENKGLLIPRVALVDPDNPIVGDKTEGLLVWNTNISGNYGTTGYYFWNGISWELLGANQSGLYKSINYVPNWSEITNKPNFATVATSGNFDDLSNKPNLALSGNKLSITGGNSITLPSTNTGSNPTTLIYLSSGF